MRLKLFLLFVVTPLVELALLIQIGQFIGLWYTIGILAITGFVGAALAKQQGFTIFRRFNQRLAAGELPGDELVQGVIILMCGALLVTPGVLTDVVGFLGLIPFTRKIIARYATKRLKNYVARGSVNVHYGSFYGGGFPGGPERPEEREDPPAGPGGWR